MIHTHKRGTKTPASTASLFRCPRFQKWAFIQFFAPLHHFLGALSASSKTRTGRPPKRPLSSLIHPLPATLNPSRQHAALSSQLFLCPTTTPHAQRRGQFLPPPPPPAPRFHPAQLLSQPAPPPSATTRCSGRGRAVDARQITGAGVSERWWFRWEGQQ